VVSALLLIPVGSGIKRYRPRPIIAFGGIALAGGVIEIGHAIVPWEAYLAFLFMGIGWAAGSATVSVKGQDVRKIGPGDYFGEIGLIADIDRTATITAETDLRCYGMTFWDFRPLVESNASIRQHGPTLDDAIHVQFPSTLSLFFASGCPS
jgi:hypothetical protein